MRCEGSAFDDDDGVFDHDAKLRANFRTDEACARRRRTPLFLFMAGCR